MATTSAALLPRWIRKKDAPGYLSMCEAEFEKTVRPNVREFPIGERGVGFERADLDAWADGYVATHAIDKGTVTSEDAKRSERCQKKGANPWPAKQSAVLRAKAIPGTSTRSLKDNDFTKALAQVLGKKQKNS